MPTITGGFTWTAGQSANDNVELMKVLEKDGMLSPFDERTGKSNFSNAKAKKVKLKKPKK